MYKYSEIFPEFIEGKKITSATATRVGSNLATLKIVYACGDVRRFYLASYRSAKILVNKVKF